MTRFWARWAETPNRSLMTLAMICGCVALTVFAVWLVWIIVWGGVWDAATQVQRLGLLGTGLFIILGLIGMCFLAFGFAVSFQSFKASAPGFSVDVQGDEEEAADERSGISG